MLALWIALGVLAVVVVPLALTYALTLPLAKDIYEDLLVRTSPDKWTRAESCTTDDEYNAMYQEALAWGERYQDRTREHTIEHDGLKLVGQFVDFGSTKTAILLCGRAEGLLYSYFYAEPYRQAGCNILVTDTRAHGNSEGKYNTLGVKESGDVLAWMQFLTTQCHTDKILLHGVCIGAATSVYTAASEHCPLSLAGVTLDGVYTSFHRVFLQRMKLMHKPVFPVLGEIEHYIKKNTGVDIQKQSPYHALPNVQVPTLFLQSRADVSSLPQYTPALFERCGSTKKQLEWFEQGAHSHVRYVNKAQYDRVVRAFAESV